MAHLCRQQRSSWQAFIALNWPAKAGVRDTPGLAQTFGAPTSGPLVWHIDRAKVENFPGGNSASLPPHGYTKNGAPDFGYDDPPRSIDNATSVGPADGNGEVQPCSSQASVAKPAWINLDEITQIASKPTPLRPVLHGSVRDGWSGQSARVPEGVSLEIPQGSTSRIPHPQGVENP